MSRRAKQIERGAGFDYPPLQVVFGSLEGLLTSEYGFGLTTATPVQRAVCHALDTGTIPDELWAIPEVSDAFGGIRPTAPSVEFLMVCGIRGAKTLIAVATCVWKALTLDFSKMNLRPGEIPRASVVSRLEENARVGYEYAVGAIRQSEILRSLMVGEPTADTITLRHYSGIPVEIAIVAMSATGVSLVSRWCIACVFDEAPRMASEDDGVINLESQRRAIRGRVVQGGVLMYIGSPLGAKGMVYQMFQENWKVAEQKIPVVKAIGPVLNPSHWTPERCAELQAADPDTYECDVLANFIDPNAQFFPTTSIEACMRKDPLVRPYDPAHRYSAAMDPGFSVNAWTLVIGHTPDNRSFVVDYAGEWRGSQTAPLSAKETLTEMKGVLDAYKVETVTSDQYAFGPIKDIAQDIGFGVSEMKFTSESRKKLYTSLRTRVVSTLLDLPTLPELKRDLQNVRKVFTKGEFQITLVETSDGRHADFAPALAILCGGYLEQAELPAPARQPRVALMDADAFEELLDKIDGRDPFYDDDSDHEGSLNYAAGW